MNIDNIEEILRQNDAVMLYFSTDNCNVCQALKPKIVDAFRKNFPKIHQVFVDAKESLEVASHYTVFAIPTIIIFIDQKEFIRKSRNLSVDSFVQEISRLYDIRFGG